MENKDKFEQYLTFQDFKQSVLGLRPLRPRDKACRETVSETGIGMQLFSIEFTCRFEEMTKKNICTSKTPVPRYLSFKTALDSYIVLTNSVTLQKSTLNQCNAKQD